MGNGTMKSHPISTSNSNTQWITVDKDGDVWFAEATGNNLGGYAAALKPTEGGFKVNAAFADLLWTFSAGLIAGSVPLAYLAHRRTKPSTRVAQVDGTDEREPQEERPAGATDIES